MISNLKFLNSFSDFKEGIHLFIQGKLHDHSIPREILHGICMSKTIMAHFSKSQDSDHVTEIRKSNK
jgi:hypothetical protein